MAFGNGLSNFGQAYRIGDAQNPFFKMQGMLPMAGLQPGGVIPGAGMPPPMLPGGASGGGLPAMLPGLGMAKALPKVARPQPVAVQKRPSYMRGGEDENRRDHSRGDGPNQRGSGGGSNSKGHGGAR